MPHMGGKPTEDTMLDDIFGRLMLFAPDSGAGGGGDGAGDGSGEGGDQGSGDGKSGEGKPENFQSWMTGQPKEIQDLFTEHESGLKSALGSERDARKDAEKKLRKMADEAEEGSAAKQRLTEMADELETQTRRTDFYEDAHAAGVTNLKLAFVVAEQDDLFDRRGRVDFDKLKELYPELFGAKPRTPPGGAGDGTGGRTPGGKKSMNDFIRKSSGR